MSGHVVAAPVAADLRPYRDALVPAYVDYCRRVSRRSMAMSIESCTYLWWLCDQKRAGRVCDLGSGFTSYTLRAYRALADWPVEVVSVDDSSRWLYRTAGFLADHRMVGKDFWRLTTWRDWLDDPGGPYDVIVHDFSRGDLRDSSMWAAAANLADAGVIMFDDAQHLGHRATMTAVCASRAMGLGDLSEWTADETGRFAALAVPG